MDNMETRNMFVGQRLLGCKNACTDGVSQTPVDADALPTIANMQVNGVATALTSTITQALDDAAVPIVGRYNYDVDTSGLSGGDYVTFDVVAIIDGQTRICPVKAQFNDLSGGPQFK